MPEITHETSVEFYVYCANCGEGLCQNTTVDEMHTRRRIPRVNVSPCPNCISDARAEGYQEGYQKARDYNE